MATKLIVHFGHTVQVLGTRPMGNIIVAIATNERGSWDLFVASEKLRDEIIKATGAQNLGTHGNNFRLHLQVKNTRDKEVLATFLREKGFVVSFNNKPHWEDGTRHRVVNTMLEKRPA